MFTLTDQAEHYEEVCELWLLFEVKHRTLEVMRTLVLEVCVVLTVPYPTGSVPLLPLHVVHICINLTAVYYTFCIGLLKVAYFLDIL